MFWVLHNWAPANHFHLVLRGNVFFSFLFSYNRMLKHCEEYLLDNRASFTMQRSSATSKPWTKLWRGLIVQRPYGITGQNVIWKMFHTLDPFPSQTRMSSGFSWLYTLQSTLHKDIYILTNWPSQKCTFFKKRLTNQYIYISEENKLITRTECNHN